MQVSILVIGHTVKDFYADITIGYAQRMCGKQFDTLAPDAASNAVSRSCHISGNRYLRRLPIRLAWSLVSVLIDNLLHTIDSNRIQLLGTEVSAYNDYAGQHDLHHSFSYEANGLPILAHGFSKV